jgi:peptidoglycan/LPS O-acetylase OafA/YrhL
VHFFISRFLTLLLSFRADAITRFLSCKFFIHLNRLEYGIYLLNPLVVTIICGFADTNHSVDIVSNYSLAIADLAISYVGAVVCAVMFEIPFGKIVNDLFPSEKCMEKRKTSMRK